jgi:hypothetical protein
VGAKEEANGGVGRVEAQATTNTMPDPGFTVVQMGGKPIRQLFERTRTAAPTPCHPDPGSWHPFD